MEYRVEKKYICTNMELAILKARLQAVMSIDKNQKEIDAYQIRSIYFDNYTVYFFSGRLGLSKRPSHCFIATLAERAISLLKAAPVFLA